MNIDFDKPLQRPFILLNVFTNETWKLKSHERRGNNELTVYSFKEGTTVKFADITATYYLINFSDIIKEVCLQ